jgi:hypothetical protein
MKGITSLLVCAAIGGCFDEGGDGSRNQAALTTAQGLIAFRDIHDNLETDPGLAGEALLEFIKTPVAASNLIAPPFDIAEMDSARLGPTPLSAVPACLTTSGEPSCDAFRTSDICEAGGFKFVGAASRHCSPCDDPTGLCAYRWGFADLSYTSPAFTLVLQTYGRWEGQANQVTASTSVKFDLTIGARRRVGELGICSCGTLTIKNSMTATGKPRYLADSQFVVREMLNGQPAATNICAQVTFDGAGNISTTGSCSCSSGVECMPTPPPPAPFCGDGLCNGAESAATCAADCGGGGTSFSTCGDNHCNPPEETEQNCPVDCPEE